MHAAASETASFMTCLRGGDVVNQFTFPGTSPALECRRMGKKEVN
jgi:hypothetical protein